MTRSVHTRPRAIRAADRLRAPFAPRRAANRRDRSTAASPAPVILPRISVQRPLPGFRHPVDRAEIARALAFFGPECVYGVRRIELRAAPPSGEGLHFGRLLVPGRVVLYAQPEPPWTLPGRLEESTATRLRDADAIIETMGGGVQTVIAWPGGTLRDFFLFDVLMHEIGHHLVQHHTGKRTARVRRTKDHEAYAALFARRCRARSVAERAG